LKNITVWYQNKRQTIKKHNNNIDISPPSRTIKERISSHSSNAATFDTLKSAQTADVKRNSPLIVKFNQRAPLSVFDNARRLQSWSTSQALPSASELQKSLPSKLLGTEFATPPQDLWEYLMSSPPAMSESSSASFSNLDQENWAADDLSNTFRRHGPRAKRKVLEWACDRQSKRMRAYRIEDSESRLDVRNYSAKLPMPVASGESGEDMEEEPRIRAVARLDSALLLLYFASARTQTGHPATLHKQLTTDVIAGASMLLDFKHSIHDAVKTAV